MPTARCAVRLALACLAVAVAALDAADTAWLLTPLATKAFHDANPGETGGEGCQVPTGLAISGDGRTLLFSTDVGGLYTSHDSGVTWRPGMVGYKPRGGVGPAIDPRNDQRMLVVGYNGGAWDWHGIWLSTDSGASWTQKLPAKHHKGAFRDQLAYDPTSFANGMCTRAYWSAPVGASGEIQGGIYRSDDGGGSWAKVNAGYGDAILKVHPTSGDVYVATATGLFRSTNRGVDFASVYAGNVRGLDILPGSPVRIVICTATEVYLSSDNAASFQKRNGAGSGLPSVGTNPGLSRIKASPANPQQMVLVFDDGRWDSQPRYFSADGGATWAGCAKDMTKSMMPSNGRGTVFVWHPTTAGRVHAFGGDSQTLSTDGGRTFRWSNDGYTGIMGTGRFCFNVTDPNILLLTSQDYDASLTLDRCASWKYMNASKNGWGGYVYGGYAINARVLIAGNAASWGGTRVLRYSLDGGATWTDTGVNLSGSDAGCGDPRDANLGFLHDYRVVYNPTANTVSWTKMANCTGVLAYNPTGNKELYGRSGKTVVVSIDHGVTWSTVATLASDPVDVAFDHVRRRLYVVTSSRRLFQYNIAATTLTDITGRMPLDNQNTCQPRAVAVDPVDPSIVYVGQSGDYYLTTHAVMRSTDAGATWTNLTKTAGMGGLDGGREANSIRVHPVTREAWVYGQCFGVWRHPAPGATAKVATPTIAPDGGVFDNRVSVQLSCATGGATIRYTLDGSTPGASSPAYSGTFTLSASATVKAIAQLSGSADSDVASASFTRSAALAAPTFTPAGGSFSGTLSVTIAGPTGATIRYTTDGSTPTASSPAYSAALSLSATTIVKAIAVKTGNSDSPVASATFTRTASLPLRISFQPTAAPAASGYEVDDGSVFGAHAIGWSYGWSRDVRSLARDRNLLTDQARDTLIHMQKDVPATWSVTIPNGQYEVTVGIGDPAYVDSTYRVSAEGVDRFDFTPTSGTRSATITRTVEVTDGTLDIGNAVGAVNNKIQLIEIATAPAAVAGSG